MSQTDLTSDSYSYDPPPSYDDICSSNTTGCEQSSTTYGFSAEPDNNWTESHEITTQSFGDKNDSTEGYSSTTHTREFSNGNEVNADDNTPTAPPSEDTGGGISGYVRSENRDDVVIPICGTSVNSGIPEYSRTREYNRVIPSRIERYRHIIPRRNVQFERDCHNLNQVDTSKLSNAEFLNWVDKYQSVLNAEERRQSTAKCKYWLFKGLLWFTVAIIVIATLIAVTRGTGTRSSSNRYLYGQGYIRNQEESDLDRIFRVNPYLNGEESIEDLSKRLDKENAELQRILDYAKSLNHD